MNEDFAPDQSTEQFADQMFSEKEDAAQFADRMFAEAKELRPLQTQSDNETILGNVGYGLGQVAQAVAGAAAGYKIDFLGDVTNAIGGAYTGGSLLLARAAVGLMGKDLPEDFEKKIWERHEKLHNQFFGFLDSAEILKSVGVPAEGSTFELFTDIGSEIRQFQNITKLMPKGTQGFVKNVGGAFGTGLIAENRDEATLINPAVSFALGKINPDLQAKMDSILDPMTDDVTARKITNQLMQGIEYSLMGVLGDLAIRGGTAVGGRIVEAVSPAAREKIVKPIRDAYGAMTRTKRTIIEARRDGLSTQQTVTRILKGGVVEDTVKLAKTPKIFDPSKTAIQNVRDQLELDFDSMAVTHNYTEKLDEFQKALAKAAPKIKQEVVNMAKAKGTAADAELETFVRELGGDVTERNIDKSLEAVLKMQAHNIVFEAEADRIAIMAKDYANKTLPSGDFFPQIKRFMSEVLDPRKAQGTEYARGLRTMQDIGPLTEAVKKSIKKSGENIDEITELMGRELANDETMKIIADNLVSALEIKKSLKLSADDFKATFLSSAATKKNAEEALKDLPLRLQILQQSKKYITSTPGAIGDMFQANILTAPPTQFMNLGGTLSMQGLDIFQNLGIAAFRGGRGDVASAMAQLTGTVQGYKTLFRNVLLRHSGQKTLAGRMVDIPALSKKMQTRLATGAKAELENVTQNPIIEDLLKIPYLGKAITGQWAFDLMRTTDVALKTPFTLGALKRDLLKAHYADDFLNVSGGLLDEKQAKKVINAYFGNGGQPLSTKQLAALGVPNKKVASVNLRLLQKSKEMSEAAVHQAEIQSFQDDIPKAIERLKVVQKFGGGFGKIVMPFLNTLYKITDRSLELAAIIPTGTHAGLPIHPRVYKMLKGSADEKAKATALIMTGNILAQVGYKLSEHGFYQPASPDPTANGFMRTVFGLTGGSFTIGDMSIPSIFLGPLHFAIAIGAGWEQADRLQKLHSIQHLDDEQERLFYDMISLNLASTMQLFRENPIATSFDQFASLGENLIAATDTDDRDVMQAAMTELATYAGRIAGGAMPNSSLVRMMQNQVMDHQKKAEGFLEGYLAGFAPGLLDNTAYNPFYEPYAPSKTLGGALRFTEIINDPLIEEMFNKTNWNPRSPKYSVRVPIKDNNNMRHSIKLNLAEYGVWEEHAELVRDGVPSEYSGMEKISLREDLKRVYQSDEFKEIYGDGTKKQVEQARLMLDAVIRRRTHAAQNVLLERYPNIRYDLIAKTKEFKGRPTTSIIRVDSIDQPTFTGAR